jgi:hypothetical protein
MSPSLFVDRSRSRKPSESAAKETAPLDRSREKAGFNREEAKSNRQRAIFDASRAIWNRSPHFRNREKAARNRQRLARKRERYLFNRQRLVKDYRLFSSIEKERREIHHERFLVVGGTFSIHHERR